MPQARTSSLWVVPRWEATRVCRREDERVEVEEAQRLTGLSRRAAELHPTMVMIWISMVMTRNRMIRIKTP